MREVGFLLEEIEQARTGVSDRPIRSNVADSPDELGLAARVNSEETCREAPLRLFAEPSESVAAHALRLERLQVTHRLLAAEIGDCQRPLVRRQVAR